MRIVDHRTDKDLSSLVEIAGAENAMGYRSFLNAQYGGGGGAVKIAAYKPVYAWPEKSLFPVHTNEDAVLSWMYCVKQASDIPQKVLGIICENVTTYGHNAEKIAHEVLCNVNAYVTTTKCAAADERDPNYLYALPDMQRLRIDTPDLVKHSAAVLIENSARLHTPTSVLASTRLVKRAQEFSMPIEDLPIEVYKYAGLTRCRIGTLLENVEARIGSCYLRGDTEGATTYDKIASVITDNQTTTGFLSDRNKLASIVDALSAADETYNLDRDYHTKLLPPQLAVFNSEKLAVEAAEIAGLMVPWSTLYAIDIEFYRDILGDGFVEHIKGEDGSVDPEQLKMIIPTLPLPQKQALATQLKAYV